MTEDDVREADRAFYRDALHSMIRVGVNMANILELRAVNGTMEGENAVIDASIAFDRVARAVRRSIMLATQLAEPGPAKPPRASPEPAEPEPEQSQPQQPADTRDAATTQATHPSPETPGPETPGPERLSPERLDRDRPEFLSETVTEPHGSQETADAHGSPGQNEPGNPATLGLALDPVPIQVAAIQRELDACQTLPILANLLASPQVHRRYSG